MEEASFVDGKKRLKSFLPGQNFPPGAAPKLFGGAALIENSSKYLKLLVLLLLLLTKCFISFLGEGESEEQAGRQCWKRPFFSPRRQRCLLAKKRKQRRAEEEEAQKGRGEFATQSPPPCHSITIDQSEVSLRATAASLYHRAQKAPC